MATTFDPTSGQYVDDISFAGQTSPVATNTESPNSPSGTPAPATPNVSPPAESFHFGSGDYPKPSNLNLTDPNELALTGLTAAQRTTPQYRPVLDRSGTGSEAGEALYNYQVEGYYPGDYRDRHPELQFQYNPIQDQPGTDLGTAAEGKGYYNPIDTNPAVGTAPAEAANYGYAGFNPGEQASAATVDPNNFGGRPGETYDAAQSDVAQAVLNSASLVEEQYKRITQGVIAGEIPDWALTAVTAARQQANGMGLGNSTMAIGATTAAILDRAFPMAQQNAQTVANLTLANLQARVQTLLSNTAMENASRQFNASSKQQASQFSQSLLSQIVAQNADRLTAISQFNATKRQEANQFFSSEYDKMQENRAARETQVSEFNATQKNAMAQFVENLRNQRLEFNAQNGLLIDQSNVQWRRTLNTANTAGQNAANQANVQNLFNLSNTAQNQLWQQARDEASWALTSGENSQNRLLSLVSSALNRQTSLQILASQLNANTFAQLGGLAANLLGGSGIGKLADNIFGGGSDGGLQGTSGGSIGGDAFSGGDVGSPLGGGDFGGGGDFNFG